MTPKEKAKELFFKYSQEVRGLFYRKSRIKRCALIAVDEIEEAVYQYGRDTDEVQNMDSTFRYLQQVKQEVENL